jgi:hypothetical protein
MAAVVLYPQSVTHSWSVITLGKQFQPELYSKRCRVCINHNKDNGPVRVLRRLLTEYTNVQGNGEARAVLEMYVDIGQ